VVPVLTTGCSISGAEPKKTQYTGTDGPRPPAVEAAAAAEQETSANHKYEMSRLLPHIQLLQ